MLTPVPSVRSTPPGCPPSTSLAPCLASYTSPSLLTESWLSIVPTPPSIAGVSDVGKLRSRNEDSLCLRPEAGIAVVADGMGGHPGGDVASRLAADTAGAALHDALEGAPQDDTGGLRAAMVESVQRAHDRIREWARQDPDLDGMGTTLTAIAFDAAGGSFVIGHVGDSRAYLLRNGALVQLTRDHTWVQDRLEAEQITAEQARHHPFGHLLTQCLGLEQAPSPEILDGDVRDGDHFLLCTDGLVGMLSDEELQGILAPVVADAGSVEEMAQVLVDAANAAGGRDNITAAIVRVGRPGSS